MNHKLTQTKEYSTGATQWECDQCGYSVVFSRSRTNRVCLNQGDTNVVHTCGMETASVSLTMNIEQVYTMPVTQTGKT